MSQASITGPLSASGNIAVGEETPIVQIEATFGLTSDVETFTATGGAATASGGQFSCATGTSVGGYGLIWSERDARVRPGQGLVARFDASFTAGVASSVQLAGLFTAEHALQFGYNGATFGTLLRTRGALEIRSLTVTVGAGGAENATVKLDGTDTVVALTAGNTAHAAWQLAQATYTGWSVSHVGSVVVWVASAVGAKAGAFSFASTGTAAGTFATTRAGATPTDTWTAQTAWNVDKMDGSGGMTIDATKLNQYQVRYSDSGVVEWSVFNTTTGRYQPVHRYYSQNTLNTPILRNPSMHVGWAAASLGSTTALTCSGTFACASVEGPISSLRNPRAFATSKAGVGATEVAILSVKNRNIFDSTLNTREIYPMRLIVATNGNGTTPVVIRIRANASLPGTNGAADEAAWTFVDATNSCAVTDVVADTVSGGTVLTAAAMSKDGQIDINLHDLQIFAHTLDVITVTASTSSGAAEVAACLTWYED